MEYTVYLENGQTMFNTGAELNVIGQELVENRTLTLKFVSQIRLRSSTIKFISVFYIMSNVFSRLIIWIRSMKKYGILINPGKDEIGI